MPLRDESAPKSPRAATASVSSEGHCSKSWKFPYLDVELALSAAAPGYRTPLAAEEAAHTKLTLPYLFPSIIDGKLRA